MGEINYLVQLLLRSVDISLAPKKGLKICSKFDFEAYSRPLKLLKSGRNNFSQIPHHLLHNSGVYKFLPLLYKIGRNKLSSPAG